jgi:amino acid transporter
LCLLINVLSLIAQFYVALYPVGGPNLDPTAFFQAYLAGPFLIFLYFVWKIYSWFKRPSDRPLWVSIKNIDIYTGMRDNQLSISGPSVSPEERRASIASIQAAQKKRGPLDYVKGAGRFLF